MKSETKVAPVDAKAVFPEFRSRVANRNSISVGNSLSASDSWPTKNSSLSKKADDSGTRLRLFYFYEIDIAPRNFYGYRMFSSPKNGSRGFSARVKKDLSSNPPTSGSHGRDASLPLRTAKPTRTPKSPRSADDRSRLGEKSGDWFGPQPAGRRKTARPFSANRPLEARLTSSRARGRWRLDRPGNRAAIRKILSREATRSGVKVSRVAIAATSLSLELAAPRRADLTQFFRAVAGRIPRAVTGSEKGRPLRSKAGDRSFWDGLVATRLSSARN